MTKPLEDIVPEEASKGTLAEPDKSSLEEGKLEEPIQAQADADLVTKGKY